MDNNQLYVETIKIRAELASELSKNGVPDEDIVDIVNKIAPIYNPPIIVPKGSQCTAAHLSSLFKST